jgi:hypothetical protein
MFLKIDISSTNYGLRHVCIFSCAFVEVCLLVATGIFVGECGDHMPLCYFSPFHL